MNTEGVQKTFSEIKAKWTSMKRTYKANFDKKNETGQGPIKWPFFDKMHQIMFKKPEVQPVSVASSISEYKKRIAEEVKDLTNSDSDGESTKNKSTNKRGKKTEEKKPPS